MGVTTHSSLQTSRSTAVYLPVIQSTPFNSTSTPQPPSLFLLPLPQTQTVDGDAPSIFHRWRATSSWSGEGSFLFTSSTAAFDCNNNGSCDEDSPIVPIGRSPWKDVLLKAENAVLHTVHILSFLTVHLDAASLSIAILKKKLRGPIFVGCDNHPLSRQEVMDLVNRSGKFSKNF